MGATLSDSNLDNPASAISAEINVEQSANGGIGRLAYFLGTLAILFGVCVIALTMLYVGLLDSEETNTPEKVLTLLGTVAAVYLVTLRLKNAAYNVWWAVCCFIPILNVYIGLVCLAGPEGYGDHKTLDVPGKIIAGLFFTIIVLSILMPMINA